MDATMAGGGCCVARYGGAASAPSQVDLIMLRFRPIAPKPALFDSFFGTARDENTARSSKRRSRASDGGKRQKRKPCEETAVCPVATLPLLPETPNSKDPAPFYSSSSSSSSSSSTSSACPDRVGSVLTLDPFRPLMASLLTVEIVSGTLWDVGSGIEETTKESLEWDTCPWFASEPLDRVTWTNEAYRKMFGGAAGGEGLAVAGLDVKDPIPDSTIAFTCRVRVEYPCVKGRQTLTAPCDAWRTRNGWFAWRLDVEAALRLGI